MTPVVIRTKKRAPAAAMADLGELVGARVIERINPEALAEVRHLEDGWLLVQIEKPGTKKAQKMRECTRRAACANIATPKDSA